MRDMTVTREDIEEITGRMDGAEILDDYRPWGTSACLAIRLKSRQEVNRFFVHAALVLEDLDALELADRAEQDSLGMETVMFFNGVEMEEESV